MHRRHGVAVAVVWLTMASAPLAQVRTRELEYKQGETVLKGFVAWDYAATGKRPGVLVVHEWYGHDEHARNQAKRLAKAGYVAFALDMYGNGKVATHSKDAEALMNEATKDPDVIAARFDAALEQLRQDPHVDPGRIAAIGYCFGGYVVLDRARAGVHLGAVVSFHGPLVTKTPAEKGKIKARVLVLTGGADPLVPPAQVQGFEQEMKAASAQFEIVRYAGAKHSFTNPDADKAGKEAIAYDARADRQSFAAMLNLFEKVFR